MKKEWIDEERMSLGRRSWVFGGSWMGSFVLLDVVWGIGDSVFTRVLSWHAVYKKCEAVSSGSALDPEIRRCCCICMRKFHI